MSPAPRRPSITRIWISSENLIGLSVEDWIGFADSLWIFLISALPIVIALCAFVYWFRHLLHPALFVVTAILSMVGLHVFLEQILNIFFGTTFYYVGDGVVKVVDSRWPLFLSKMSIAPSTIALVLLGLPFLRWLKSVFHKT